MPRKAKKPSTARKAPKPSVEKKATEGITRRRVAGRARSVPGGSRAMKALGMGAKAAKGPLGRMVAKLFGSGMGGPMSIIMALWVLKDIADMAGLGPRSREIAAGKEAGQANLLANAMLIGEDRTMRQEDRMEASLTREHEATRAEADRASMERLAALQMQIGGVRGQHDLYASLGQAVGMGSIAQAMRPQPDMDRPSQLMGY